MDSRPEVEGPSDEDSEMEMLDLDDSDESDSGSDGGVDVEGDDDSDLIEDKAAYMDELDEALADGSEAGSDEDDLFEKEFQTSKPDEAEDKGKQSSREKRKKLKGLPTFASSQDYAKMLDDDEDEYY